ncbi:unnamed protein product, partial [Hapterophycus canaliculatus]
PLHLAALGGHVGATRALIAAGCDTSLSNLHGNTALHLACAKARWGVARSVVVDSLRLPSSSDAMPPSITWKCLPRSLAFAVRFFI